MLLLVVVLVLVHVRYVYAVFKFRGDFPFVEWNADTENHWEHFNERTELIRKRNMYDSPWSSVYYLWTNKQITLCDMNVIAHGSNNLCITCSRCCTLFFPFGCEPLSHSVAFVPCAIQRRVSVAPSHSLYYTQLLAVYIYTHSMRWRETCRLVYIQF